MKWVLLVLAFSGPTSPDKISYKGPFPTKEACEAAAPQGSWVSPDNWVCIPVGDTK